MGLALGLKWPHGLNIMFYIQNNPSPPRFLQNTKKGPVQRSGSSSHQCIHPPPDLLTPTGGSPAEDSLRLWVEEEESQRLLFGDLHRSTIVLLKGIYALFTLGRHLGLDRYLFPLTKPPKNSQIQNNHKKTSI